jgi:hypothetical protein
MIIAALVTFAALLACWLFAASDPEQGRQAPAQAATADQAAAELARAA